MAISRKLMAIGAAGAVAAGAVLGANAATAANDPGFTKVKTRKAVKAGKTFLIKCQLDATQNWTGAYATLLEKGAAINASRSVSSNGDCSMHVVLDAVGQQKIRVVIEQNGGAIQSRWLKINVKPAPSN